MQDRIARVRTAVIRCHLDTPIHFGDWMMDHRDFALVRIDSDGGRTGFAYCLTRDGPVEEIIRRTVAPVYVGRDVSHPESSFFGALWTNHAVHASGIGMRALSVVDIAAWDLAAKASGVSITKFLGGDHHPMPATAIVGYPPSISPAETAVQVEQLWTKGWRRFKLPIAPNEDLTLQRLAAAREAAPDGWIGLDANMVYRSAEDALEFERRLRPLGIGWFEDIVPPGDAEMVARIRNGSATPIAMGDEQGGSYHPQALMKFGAIDVLRVDATTNGGVTRLRSIVREAIDEGLNVAPHMFPHVHSQVMSALGIVDAPIEWGVPGTGVHPMDDPLPQAQVVDGKMKPLPEAPGFGKLVEPAWLAHQDIHDPEGVLEDIKEGSVL